MFVFTRSGLHGLGDHGAPTGCLSGVRDLYKCVCMCLCSFVCGGASVCVC